MVITARRIVDAVTDLADLESLCLKLAHNLLLVLRQKLGTKLDAEITSDRIGRASVVACQHHGSDAKAGQFLKAPFRILSRLVTPCYEPDWLTVHHEDRNSFAFILEWPVVRDRSSAGCQRPSENR